MLSTRMFRPATSIVRQGVASQRLFHASRAAQAVHYVKTASEEAEFKDKVHFVKFDVDELPELSQELGIRAMPTFLFFKNGEKVDEMIGANPPLLLQTLRKHNA
ncbi:hypothetical protein ACHAQJ_000290 [Trichoderma viride]